MNTLFPTMIYRKWLCFLFHFRCVVHMLNNIVEKNLKSKYKMALKRYSLLQLWSILREIWDVFNNWGERDFMYVFFLYLPFGNAARRHRHHRHRICLFFFCLFFLALMKLESQSNRKQDTKIQWNLNMRRKFGIVIWQLVSVEWCPRGAIIFSLFVKDEKTTVNLKCEHFFFPFSPSLSLSFSSWDDVEWRKTKKYIFKLQKAKMRRKKNL